MATTPPPPPAPAVSSSARPYSGEEYRMYFESTEKVVDRRLALNSWNYGICIAIIVACGVIANLALSQASFRLVLIAVIFLLCLMGVMLCRLWIKQIKDYKSLNDAKFGVLNKMAPEVHFADGGRSFEPFKKEWKALDGMEATVRQAGLTDKVLKASNAEMMIPKAFGGLFIGLMILLAVASAVNFKSLITDPLRLPAEKAPTPNVAR
jgi:hypothetical protein